MHTINNLPFKLTDDQIGILTNLETYTHTIISSKRQKGLTTVMIIDLAKLVQSTVGKFLWVNKNTQQHLIAIDLLYILIPDGKYVKSKNAFILSSGSEIFFLSDSQLQNGLRGRNFKGMYIDDAAYLNNIHEIFYCFDGKKVLGWSFDEGNGKHNFVNPLNINYLSAANYKRLEL